MLMLLGAAAAGAAVVKAAEAGYEYMTTAEPFEVDQDLEVRQASFLDHRCNVTQQFALDETGAFVLRLWLEVDPTPEHGGFAVAYVDYCDYQQVGDEDHECEFASTRAEWVYGDGPDEAAAENLGLPTLDQIHEWIVDNVELPEQEETYDAYQAL